MDCDGCGRAGFSSGSVQYLLGEASATSGTSTKNQEVRYGSRDLAAFGNIWKVSVDLSPK